MQTHRHDHHTTDQRASEAGARTRGHGGENHASHASKAAPAVPTTATPRTDAREGSAPAGMDD